MVTKTRGPRPDFALTKVAFRGIIFVWGIAPHPTDEPDRRHKMAQTRKRSPRWDLRDDTATAAPDLTALREAVEEYRERRAEYDRTEDGDFSAAAEDIALTAFMGATWNIVNAADALFPEDGTP